MRSMSFYHRIFFLTVIQIILFCLSSFASGTVIDQRDYSLLDGGYTLAPGSLSPDGAELLAMAADTGATASPAAYSEASSGPDLGIWHKYLGLWDSSDGRCDRCE